MGRQHGKDTGESRFGGISRKSVELGLEGLCAIRSKWSLPTRLETRTKESNVHASMLVEKLTCEMKVRDAKRKQQHQPTMILW